jgi:hypothetical protein
MLSREFDSLIAIARVQDLPAVLVEHRAEDPAAIRIVVDDKYGFHAGYFTRS